MTSRPSPSGPAGPRRRRWIWIALLLALTAAPAAAEPLRGPYLGLRVGPQLLLDRDVDGGLEASTLHSLYGVSVGLDIGRYLGVELAADFFEPDLRLTGQSRFGELGTALLVPQLRLRYPLLDGRLVPYLIGGLGVSFTEFNDRKPPGFGRSIRAEDTALAWTAGAGLEYFVASNIAVGAELRYAGLGRHEVRVDGQRFRADLDSLLATAGTRVYLRDGPAARGEPGAGTWWVPFLTVRAGGGGPVKDRIARGLEANPDNNDVIPGVNNVVGVAVGVELGPLVTVEVAGEGYEINLAVPGLGTIGEYAWLAVTPLVRLRYPLLAGRLLPAAIVGVGASFAEFNDRKPPGAGLDIKGRDWSLLGTVGAGVEYLFAANLGIGLDLKYFISRGHQLRLGGDTRDVNMDGLSVTAGLRLRFR